MEKRERVRALIAASKGIFTADDQAMLEGASDEHLARYEAKFAETPPQVAPTKEPAVEPKADVKPPTFDELLAQADPATREAIAEGKRVGEAKRAATIKAIKDTGRCKYTDAELGHLSQADLDKLVELASIKPAVDFSGQGAPKDDTKQTAPTAPDLAAALRAK